MIIPSEVLLVLDELDALKFTFFLHILDNILSDFYSTHNYSLALHPQKLWVNPSNNLVYLMKTYICLSEL